MTMASFFDKETVPVLATTMSFVAQRHSVIANNIANVDTQGYKAQDLDEGSFRLALKTAIEGRKTGETSNPRDFRLPNDPLRYSDGYEGGYQFKTTPHRDKGPMRHDENTVVMENEMSRMSKNSELGAVVQRLLSTKYKVYSSAIRGRTA